MSQPPYPPSGDEPTGREGWAPPEENRSGRQPTEEYGQYGQPGQYGQYGEQQYGQPQYGQYTPPGHYGQYGQQPGPYGQQPGQYAHYGQPPYGQGPYGQYGGPVGYGPVPPPAGPGKNRGSMIALIVGGVVLVAGIVVAVILGLTKDNTPTASGAATATAPSATDSFPADPSSDLPFPTAAGGTVPPAKEPPTGLGSDQILNRFAQDCYSGNMDSCDLLYLAADADTPYEKYGDTCAGRRPEGQDPLCSEEFPD